jgi:hypothetical protein
MDEAHYLHDPLQEQLRRAVEAEVSVVEKKMSLDFSASPASGSRWKDEKQCAKVA